VGKVRIGVLTGVGETAVAERKKTIYSLDVTIKKLTNATCSDDKSYNPNM